MSIENWQLKYIENRPSEVMGQRPMSQQFFQTLSEQGPIAAFQWVRSNIQEHGHDQATLKAVELIIGSAILAAGVTTTFNNLLEQKNDGNFSLLDQARLLFYSGLYAGSVGLIMTSHSEIEADRSYYVAHDIDGQPVIVHGGGGMTEEQAKEAIKKGFY